MEDLVWKTSDAVFVITVGTATVCFCLYWFVAHSERLKAWVDARNGDGYFDQYGAVYQKLIGVLYLGGLPMLATLLLLPGTPENYGLGDANWTISLYWILLFGGAISFIPWYTARQKEMYSFYPQIRARDWSRRLLVVNALVWTLYMFAYEFLFRGFLLMGVASVYGWWPAIIVTTALSATTHLPKGGKETFGTIPLSIVLSLIVIQTGAIWACVAAHAILAISNDYWAVFYHPEMRFKENGVLEEVKSSR
ncbi:MAG: CPBP family intramembrane glutamic endopeptidase [Bacteroidota bacterium]